MIVFCGSSYVESGSKDGATFLIATGILAHLLSHVHGGSGLGLGSLRSALGSGNSGLKPEASVNSHSPPAFVGNPQGCGLRAPNQPLNILPSHNAVPLINGHNYNFLRPLHGLNIGPQIPIINFNPHSFNSFVHGQNLLQMPQNPIIGDSLNSYNFQEIFKNPAIGFANDGITLGNFEMDGKFQNVPLPEAIFHKR